MEGGARSRRHFFTSTDGQLYEGWTTVFASALCTAIAVGSVAYGLGSVFEPIRTELGWSTLFVSLGFGLRSEVGGLAAPLVGAALDSAGPRIVARAGVIISAAGVAGLSIVQERWQFLPAMALIAVGSSAAGGQVGHHAVATWFRARRGRAMSLMTLGGAFGGLSSVIVAQGVVEIGWRATLRWLALLIVVVGLVVTRWIRARPVGHHQPLDGLAAPDPGAALPVEWSVPYREAIRSSAFARILSFNLAADFGRLAYLTHLVAFVDRDLGATGLAAGVTLTVSTLASAPGRVGAGVLIDRYPIRVVSALTMVPFAGGTALLAFASEPWHAYVAAGLGGIGFGASIPVRPAMYVDYFGLGAFGRIMGIGRLASTTAGFLGGVLVGWIVDQSDGSYAIGWGVVTAVVLASVPLMLAARPPEALQRRHRVA